jgi:hypothetical protein
MKSDDLYPNDKDIYSRCGLRPSVDVDSIEVDSHDEFRNKKNVGD